MQIGFWGKIPTTGDFVSRGVRSELIDGFDSWLQHGVSHSKELLQDRWLEKYLTAHIWRFYAKNTFSADSVCTGVICPSVDRVGRYFPLIFVLELRVENAWDISCLQTRRSWFTALESIALRALHEPLDADTLQAELTKVSVQLSDMKIPESENVMGVELGLSSSDLNTWNANWLTIINMLCDDVDYSVWQAVDSADERFSKILTAKGVLSDEFYTSLINEVVAVRSSEENK